MFLRSFLGLVGASLLFPSINHAAGFADNFSEYLPGSGFSAGFTNAASALGEPSRFTGGQFPCAVDPFSPAYLPEQLVSIGAGGSLTLHFDAGIPNDPSNPFGLDFIVF